MQTGKEEIKLFLFVNDMIVYVENPKKSTKTLPLRTNEFSSVTGYNINIEISIEFLYISKHTWTSNWKYL